MRVRFSQMTFKPALRTNISKKHQFPHRSGENIQQLHRASASYKRGKKDAAKYWQVSIHKMAPKPCRLTGRLVENVPTSNPKTHCSKGPEAKAASINAT